MRCPAAIPAAAILVGTAAACFTTASPAWPATAASLAWLTAVGLSVAPRGGRCVAAFCAAVFLAFLLAAWSLAAPAFRALDAPPLRAALAGALPTSSPVALEGRLRSDASLTSNGVALDLEVGVPPSRQPADTPDAGAAHPLPARPPVSGGVRLTVSGALATSRVGDWTEGRLLAVSASLREPIRSLNPGVPDSRRDLARRGTALVGGVKSAALVDVRRAGTWWQERSAALRAFAREALGRHVGRWGRQSAAITIAILIGDRVGLDDETQQLLREAGTYHVIAISGGNIAILAALMFTLLRAARVSTRVACWLVVVGLVAYASLVGGGSSVVRATLMAACYLAARQADYRSPPLNALAVACAAILVATPLSLTDVGFALTFGATLGILAGATLFGGQRSGPAWLRAAKGLLFASVYAELALFPVAAYAFSRVTFAGLVLNFLAIPLMTLAQVAGMVVLPLALVCASAASAVGWAAHVGASGLVWSAGLVNLAPWLSWRLPPPHPAAIACYYAALAGLVALRGHREGWRNGCLVVAACAGAWILTEPVTLLAPGVSGRLRVTVLDVGHADAVLVQLPDRRSLLVDAAGSMMGGSFDVGGRVLAPALWALGTRRLEALLITHGDPDHVGGALSVVDDFRPRQVWEGVPVPRSPAMAALRERAGRGSIAWCVRRRGETLRYGEVEIRVLHPSPPEWERQKVRNDDSVVLDLRYRGISVVLSGDIGASVERTIASDLLPARFRVLKVPHHGSATSSSEEFLAALRPDVALISAGPTTKVRDEVLARYRAVGSTILRTSDEGAVTVTTDGREVVVETMAGRRVHTKIGTTKDTKDTKDPKKTKEPDDTKREP